MSRSPYPQAEDAVAALSRELLDAEIERVRVRYALAGTSLSGKGLFKQLVRLEAERAARFGVAAKIRRFGR